MPTSLLCLGGMRSGKSRHAAQWVLGMPGPHTYLATARHELADHALRARIAASRAERHGHGWVTVEEPYGVVQIIRDSALGAVLVDCTTRWVANLSAQHAGDEHAVLAVVDQLCALLADPPVDIAIVSDELGQACVTDDASHAQCHLQGLANQRLAAACHQVTLLVAGIPLVIKPG